MKRSFVPAGELSRGRMILLGPGEDAEVAFYTIDHTYDILPFKVCGKRWKMKGYGEIHVEHQRLRFGVGGPESHTQAIYLDFYPIDEERVRSAQEIRDYHGICVNRMGHDYGIHGKQVLGDITFVDP